MTDMTTWSYALSHIQSHWAGFLVVLVRFGGRGTLFCDAIARRLACRFRGARQREEGEYTQWGERRVWCGSTPRRLLARRSPASRRCWSSCRVSTNSTTTMTSAWMRRKLSTCAWSFRCSSSTISPLFFHLTLRNFFGIWSFSQNDWEGARKP